MVFGQIYFLKSNHFFTLFFLVSFSNLEESPGIYFSLRNELSFFHFISTFSDHVPHVIHW
jgi:hypothetical protein